MISGVERRSRPVSRDGAVTKLATDEAVAVAIEKGNIDRVVIECVNTLTPVWQDRLAGFDVFIYDQCLAMEQSIRVDGPSL